MNNKTPERVWVEFGPDGDISKPGDWSIQHGFAIEYVRADLLGDKDALETYSEARAEVEALEITITQWKVEEKAWAEETERLERVAEARRLETIDAVKANIHQFTDGMEAGAAEEHRRILERLEGLSAIHHPTMFIEIISKDEALKVVDDD